jgi:hypothetical protein
MDTAPSQGSGNAWHLEICEADYVGFWHGEPASYREEPDPFLRLRGVHIRRVDWALRLPAEPVKGLHAVELDRVHGFGWRFHCRDRKVASQWRVSPTREAAIEEARTYAESEVDGDPAKRRDILDAFHCVRDTEPHLTWSSFFKATEEARAAALDAYLNRANGLIAGPPHNDV